MSAASAGRRLDLLIEIVETECDPIDDVCHGHDLEGGDCALLLDLKSIRAEIERN